MLMVVIVMMVVMIVVSMLMIMVRMTMLMFDFMSKPMPNPPCDLGHARAQCPRFIDRSSIGPGGATCDHDLSSACHAIDDGRFCGNANDQVIRVRRLCQVIDHLRH